jgi:hypothetical protein
MPYTETWGSLTGKAEQHARSTIRILNENLEAYNDWQTFRGGRSNADIATALGVTETDVANMDACFSAFKAIYDHANNVSPSQGDRFYAMRIFA